MFRIDYSRSPESKKNTDSSGETANEALNPPYETCKPCLVTETGGSAITPPLSKPIDAKGDHG